MLYFWLKLMHILSSTVLFGTGIGSAFYLLRAHLSKDDRAMLFASKNVVLADGLFTTPAVIIQPITGIGLMHVLGYPFETPWLFWSLILYVVMLGCWIPVVWLQIQIRKSVASGNTLYLRYMRYWFWLGWPAFIAIIMIFYLMVFKPAM